MAAISLRDLWIGVVSQQPAQFAVGTPNLATSAGWEGVSMMKFPHLPYIYMAETKILCQRYQLHIVYTPFLHLGESVPLFFILVYSIITMEFEDSETLWLKSCRTFHTLVPSLLHFHWREVMQTDTYES